MRKRSIALIVAIVLTLGSLGSLAFAQTAVQGEPNWKARFTAHDRNKDGRIDREEFQQWMVEVFYIRDKDRKGYLIQEDVRGVMAPETLKAINRMGDGKLSLQEFLNAAFQDFAAADVNQNGSLSMEEIEVHFRLPAN